MDSPAPENAITEAVKMLNTNVNERYTLSYNPWLDAWTVLYHKRLDVNTQNYVLIPFSVSHKSASMALRDALILKLHASKV